VAWQPSRANLFGSGVIDDVLSYAGGRQLYSKKFSKKCSRLLAKAHDFVKSMEELGTEALPPDHHGLQPLVLVLIVSPMEGNKVSSYVGSALANEAPFQAVVQATANTMVACQHAKGLAAKACADAGQPIKPPQQQTKGPRSEYHAKQLRFAVYWRKELKGKLPDPKSKLISSKFFLGDMRTRCSSLPFSFCPCHLFELARGACSGTNQV
jgi:hypothetical protein